MKSRLSQPVLLIAALAGPLASTAAAGPEVVWQGEGGRFVEVERKVSRSSIALTLHAHNFGHHRPEGRLLAVAALDQATGQLIDEYRRLPQYRSHRLAESQRRDRAWGRVMTRTVELMVVNEDKILAAERERQEDAEREYQRKKDAAERAEREYQRKKEAAEDADQERQKKQAEADRAARDRQQQQDAADRTEREHAQRQAAAATAVAPPAGARPVRVRVVPGGTNQSLQAVHGYATERHFLFDCQADPRHWPSAAGGLPLLMTVYDTRGTVLGRFTSPGRYIARNRVGRETMDDLVVLQPTSNRLIFEVDEAIAKQANLIELGFADSR